MNFFKERKYHSTIATGSIENNYFIK
jgi:hypothetical protein